METTGFQTSITVSTGEYIIPQYKETTGGCYNPIPEGWSYTPVSLEL